MHRLIILIGTFAINPGGMTAACCGGGAVFPNLISTDDRAQLNFSSSFAKVIGDAPSDGKPVFRSGSDDEWIHTYRLDGAYVFADLWQAALSLPVVKRSRKTQSASAAEWGVGDVVTTLGYEFLPEYNYSRWKPKGFLFLQLTLPTGGNIYESNEMFAVDARGKGFYTFSLGSYFLKNWSWLDLAFRALVSKSLDQKFKAADQSTIHVKPGVDLSSSLGVGFSPYQTGWRIGVYLNPLYNAPTNVGRYKLVWNSGIELSKLFANSYLFGVSYNDQTLIGPARNTSLERSAELFVRYKWQR